METFWVSLLGAAVVSLALSLLIPRLAAQGCHGKPNPRKRHWPDFRTTYWVRGEDGEPVGMARRCQDCGLLYVSYAPTKREASL